MEYMGRQATMEKLASRLEIMLEEWERIGYLPNPANLRFKERLKGRIVTVTEQLVLLSLFADGRQEVTAEERIQTVKDYLNARIPRSVRGTPFITYEELKHRDYIRGLGGHEPT